MQHHHDYLTHTQPTDLLTALLARFGGRVIVPFSEGLEAISFPVQTARNQRAMGTFPIPVRQRGNRLFLSVLDLANFAEGNNKRGRKTKTEKIAAAGGSK